MISRSDSVIEVPAPKISTSPSVAAGIKWGTVVLPVDFHSFKRASVCSFASVTFG